MNIPELALLRSWDFKQSAWEHEEFARSRLVLEFAQNHTISSTQSKVLLFIQSCQCFYTLIQSHNCKVLIGSFLYLPLYPLMIMLHSSPAVYDISQPNVDFCKSSSPSTIRRRSYACIRSQLVSGSFDRKQANDHRNGTISQRGDPERILV